MNSFPTIIFAAIFGLLAGIGHGVMTHKTDLPISFSDQLFESLYTSSEP